MRKNKAISITEGATNSELTTAEISTPVDEKQFSTQEKLGIRELQIAIMNCRDEARKATEKAASLENSLNQYLNKKVVDLGIDLAIYHLDFNTLTFVKKPDAK